MDTITPSRSPSPAEVLGRSRAHWTAAATVWDREGDVIAASTRPVTDALLELAAIGAGARVLDVAGGTGDPAIRLTAAVGASGRVVCTDLAPAMLAGARRRVPLASGGFVAAAAEALPFRAGGFDAVVSRFGVMLFADPAAGVREMLRVARPGGVVAAAVWGAPERNPYLAVPIGTIAHLAAVPPQDPDAPGVFRLGGPGQLAALFARAGGRDVREERRAFSMEAPIALDDFWPFLLRLASPMRAVVESLPSPLQDEIGAAVREAVLPYFAAGTMCFPAEMVVVRAMKEVTGR